MEGSVQPVPRMTRSHLWAIISMLYFYERHLWHVTAPSAIRAQQIADIQLLRVKLQRLSDTPIVVLNRAEVGYIGTAITVFIAQAREKIPQTPQREEILAGCEALRSFLVNRAGHTNP